MYISDEAIIELYFARDERALEETDIKYGKMLFRIAYNILHDSSDCEECKNDTYLGAWNTIPPARPAVFPAFITQIMRNIAINRYREKASKKRIPSEMTVALDELEATLCGDMSPEDELSAKELGNLLNSFIQKLPERRRYIFIGRYYLAKTMEELARELHIGIGTVYRETEKIKHELKSQLERSRIHE